MPRYFLRVEAVNLDNIIDDTDDLSTRRGGGLMAMNAPGQLLGDEKTPGNLHDEATRIKLKPICTGASIGLFELTADSDEGAEKVVEAVREHFRSGSLEYEDTENKKTEHIRLHHGTFSIDAVAVGENEYEVEQLLLAKIRWQQLSTPTISLAGLWEPTNKPCEYDFVRPGVVDELKAPNHPKLSNSVAERRKYGRYAKQQFYRDELQAVGDYPGYEFTNDFQEIAEHPDGDDSSMHNKLAVFYVDGNQFGEKGRRIFQEQGAAGFKEWSDALRKHHRTLLRDLLKRTEVDELWSNSGKIRLETPLWGGDEIIWIVPAWKGWELVEWFFGQKHEIVLRGETKTLSYACGLVFSNAKAPIKNVRILAKDKLGEAAKRVGRADNVHRLAYEVLESFDDISGDFDKYRKKWLPPMTSISQLVLDPTRKIWEPLRKLAGTEEFPMRQLYNCVKAWRQEDQTKKSKAIKRLETADPEKELQQFISGEVDYLHLLQMIPYTSVPKAVTS